MDYKKVQDRYADSISQYDVNGILNNGKHGELNFSEIEESANKMTQTIYELELFDFRNIGLPQVIVREIESFRGSIMNLILAIKDFTINRPDATQVRQDWVNQIRSAYDNGYYRIEEILNNLKIRNLLQDKGELQKKINSVSDIEGIKNQLLATKDAFENELKQLKSATKEKGNEVGNLESSEFFDAQATIHGTEKQKWRDQRKYFFISLIIWAAITIGIYFYIEPIVNVADGIELGILGLLGFILLYFGFSFSTNNYYIERGLEIENLHRKNIANTAPKLQLGVTNEDHRAIIIGEEVKSLFSPIGAKMEGKGTEITTPFLEVIKSLIGKIG